ncbi:MAG: hypothetical protein JRH13_00200 [Deltaproteobacteria bacterium]|nr:hypothetical protein [Deltaproteobacteria bacterium]MBW2017066.1 hypothetical protein [Deltaproteobacteria bacterium]MBW2127770.1 hypothetical protein [Deltaproteobacteria bacterium]MBW2303170.1 hypothetical protein [Deltaproteobacteria bacterium]
MIIPDYTLFIQIANFLVLLFLLNIFLYRPIRGMLRKREEEMGSFQGSIDQFLEKFSRYQQELEANILGTRREGYQAKENIKSEGLEEERGMLQKASSTANERIEKAKQEIEQSMEKVRRALEEEVGAFSRELAEKVLGRSI